MSGLAARFAKPTSFNTQLTGKLLPPTKAEFPMPKETPDVINFYTTTGEYGCFSNFSKHPISLNGKSWPTSEHYFQAQKFHGTQHEEEVRLAKTAMIAARMGRDRNAASVEIGNPSRIKRCLKQFEPSSRSMRT